MIVNRDDVQLLKGKIGLDVLENGDVVVKKHHCVHCATTLWYSADAYPNVYALRPGTFDDVSTQITPSR